MQMYICLTDCDKDYRYKLLYTIYFIIFFEYLHIIYFKYTYVINDR